MRIEETDEDVFKPVKVVFESQAEIDYILFLLGMGSSDIAEAAGVKVDSYQMYSTFLEIGSKLRDRGKYYIAMH